MKKFYLSFLMLACLPTTAAMAFERADTSRIDLVDLTYHGRHGGYHRRHRGPIRRLQCTYRGRFGRLKVGVYRYDRFGRLYCGKVFDRRGPGHHRRDHGHHGRGRGHRC